MSDNPIKTLWDNDRAMREIESLRQQLDWVRNIVSMHGYDGPFGDGCCPLAEWLNEREYLRQQVDNLTEANRIMCEDFAAENNKGYQLEQQVDAAKEEITLDEQRVADLMSQVGELSNQLASSDAEVAELKVALQAVSDDWDGEHFHNGGRSFMPAVNKALGRGKQ